MFVFWLVWKQKSVALPYLRMFLVLEVNLSSLHECVHPAVRPEEALSPRDSDHWLHLKSLASLRSYRLKELRHHSNDITSHHRKGRTGSLFKEISDVVSATWLSITIQDSLFPTHIVIHTHTVKSERHGLHVYRLLLPKPGYLVHFFIYRKCINAE